MPIKDKRAGLVGELEETAFLPLLFKVFFFLSEVWRHDWNLLLTIIAGRFGNQGKIKGGVD